MPDWKAANFSNNRRRLRKYFINFGADIVRYEIGEVSSKAEWNGNKFIVKAGKMVLWYGLLLEKVRKTRRIKNENLYCISIGFEIVFAQ